MVGVRIGRFMFVVGGVVGLCSGSLKWMECCWGAEGLHLGDAEGGR